MKSDGHRDLIPTDNLLDVLYYFVLIDKPDNSRLGCLCFYLLVLSLFFHACQCDLGNTESLTSSSGRRGRLRASNSLETPKRSILDLFFSFFILLVYILFDFQELYRDDMLFLPDLLKMHERIPSLLGNFSGERRRKDDPSSKVPMAST